MGLRRLVESGAEWRHIPDGQRSDSVLGCQVHPFVNHVPTIGLERVFQPYDALDRQNIADFFW